MKSLMRVLSSCAASLHGLAAEIWPTWPSATERHAAHYGRPPDLHFAATNHYSMAEYTNSVEATERALTSVRENKTTVTPPPPPATKGFFMTTGSSPSSCFQQFTEGRTHCFPRNGNLHMCPTTKMSLSPVYD